MSGRQQFELHLVKGKILERREKGKGALKGSRTADLEERANGGGTAIAYGKCIQRFTHAWAAAPLLHPFNTACTLCKEGAY